MSELSDWVQLNPHASQPLFDQLRTQMIAGIHDGRLAAGSRLPTVRDLAARLGLAVNTVARTYRELEAAGVVETRRRFGTFVARTDPADKAMAQAARTYVDKARGLGVTRQAAIRYIENEFG